MNTPQDLNAILFEQLNKLKNAEPRDLADEIDRAQAIGLLAEHVVKNNQTIVDYTKVCVSAGATMKDTAISQTLLK